MIYAPWNEFCMIWVFWHLSDGFSRELWSLSHPTDQDPSWKRYPPPQSKNWKKISVLTLSALGGGGQIDPHFFWAFTTTKRPGQSGWNSICWLNIWPQIFELVPLAPQRGRPTKKQPPITAYDPIFFKAESFGTSGRRCSRSPFRRLTGNDVSGHYFHHYFLFFSPFFFVRYCMYYGKAPFPPIEKWSLAFKTTLVWFDKNFSKEHPFEKNEKKFFAEKINFPAGVVLQYSCQDKQGWAFRAWVPT